MASPASAPSKHESPAQVVLRNTLRYTISAKEYTTLHRYLITRSPPIVQRSAPLPKKFDAIVKSRDDYNAAAIRASLRVFVAAQSGLKLWDIIIAQFRGKGKATRLPPKVSIINSPNFRLSLSVSLILLLHRILYRFLSRLRSNLLTKDAAPFRRRNPRISRTLTSRLAPAIGASFAGFALGVYPGDQLRITITIYMIVKAAEFAYNALEDDGWFKSKPWWVGSWMLMPVAAGQLLHAFVFDRDCFPKAYGDFILKNTPNYIQRRPPTYPPDLPWPSNEEIVDSLAEMSRKSWPPFVSPILFPAAQHMLPQNVSVISPITSPAHPAIHSLSCALLHPSDPSCLRTYVTFHLAAFPPLAKFFALIFGLFALPRYKSFYASPARELNGLAKRVLRMTVFMSGAIGTSWSSICLFQYLLPRTVIPTQRWFWGGFLGGLWSFLERKNGKGQYLYSARMSIDSVWKVGVKRGWWKQGKNRDVGVFVVSLMLLNALYEINPKAIDSGIVRKGLSMLRGEGWNDKVKGLKKAK